MRLRTLMMLMSVLLIATAQSVQAMGMGESGPCMARNAIEAYCVSHGGCPKNGICYFSDGGYCDLLSYYNGTCPGQGYYEQAIWMAEAYRFLNTDYSSPNMPYGGYYSPYTPYGRYYSPNVPYGYGNAYGNYWPNYGLWYGPDWL